MLLDRGKHIYSVYFPLSSVASLLNMVEGSGGVEIATVGNEGLLGLSVSWGIDTLNPQEFVQCQVPGDALVMDAETFAAKLAAGGELSGGAATSVTGTLPAAAPTPILAQPSAPRCQAASV